jgi:hypothetical protein
MVLAAVSGVTFGHAWTIEQGGWWWVGGMTLLAAVLFILSAMYREPQGVGAAPAPRSAQLPGLGPATPLLGQMLVQRGLITLADLDKALGLQKGSKQRLGDILVEMGLLTHAELAEVLEEQLVGKDGQLSWR